MKRIDVILGGTYFLEERLGFFDNAESRRAEHISVKQVDWRDVRDNRQLSWNGDAVFVFGIKAWVRRLKKQRYDGAKIVKVISRFLSRNFGSKPIGLLDDLDVRSSRTIGCRIIGSLLKRLDCRVVLLREYLKGQSYQDRVYPFGMCSPSRLNMRKPVGEKDIDIYFRGDNSSSERMSLIRGVKSIKAFKVKCKVYRGGSVSGQKLPPEKFFAQLANARIGLNVRGNGYSCYRYQEIPSVGSIVASKAYPLVTPNDYVDMESCIKFDNMKEFASKAAKVLSNANIGKDMTAKSIEHFERYHTTEKRFVEFLNFLDLL